MSLGRQPLGCSMMRDTENNFAKLVFRDRRAGQWLAIVPLVLTLAWAAGATVPVGAQSDTGIQSLTAGHNTAGRVLRVGPQREWRSIAAAAQQARAGDTIEVDPGDYIADVAVWNLERLTIRAVGGRARLIAAGASAEGKAIWVIRRGVMVVENFDFIGTRVRDRNGAGIRFESGHLTVINCVFIGNQMGILPNNDPAAELVVENSEFDSGGPDEPRSHNLYVGAIAKLTVQGSYFHHGKGGHLLKTRAAQSHILYNRLTDEAGGTASYELEFPNGGVAVVVGNLIVQGAQSPNAAIISYGVEGYRWPQNRLCWRTTPSSTNAPLASDFCSCSPVTGKSARSTMSWRAALRQPVPVCSTWRHLMWSATRCGPSAAISSMPPRLTTAWRNMPSGWLCQVNTAAAMRCGRGANTSTRAAAVRSRQV